MKIILILPTLTQPRFHKRISTLKKKFPDVEIYAFDRGLYKENSISLEDVIILGQVANKNYIQRFGTYFETIKILLKRKEEDTLFYFFTFDSALLGFLILDRKRYIYEISDFAYFSFSKIIVKLFTRINLRIIRKSYITVLTSMGFKDYLSSITKQKSLENLLVIPNKMPRTIKKFQRGRMHPIDLNHIRFGFVGILRYRNTVLRFVEIIGKNYPQHTFIYYGDGGLKEEFLSLCELYSNLQYGGAFKNPDDLEKIYGDFDVHIACYDTNGFNQKIAEPNKLYESVYFGRPIIATKGSFFATRVEEMGVGFAIDASKEKNIIGLLNSLPNEKLQQMSERMLQIPSEELIYCEESLIDKLMQFERNLS